MKVEHVYRVASSGWQHCYGQQVESVLEWPCLNHAALVILDLDGIVSDVWRFEGKAEYAAALIEKRVRTEGLVDGSAHIVIHRVLEQPGGFQVFFSAVDLEFWQRCLQWAKEQKDHCLISISTELLCDSLGNNQGRFLLSQRRLMCFAQTDVGMVFSTAQTLGYGSSTLVGAAKTMATQHRDLLQRMDEGALQWASLWVTEKSETGLCLEAVRSVVGTLPVVVPAQQLSWSGATVHSILPSVMQSANRLKVLNPVVDRMAWTAERWVMPVAGATALVGLALAISGGWMFQLAEQQRLEAMEQRAQLQQIHQRIQAVASIEMPRKLMPVADFSLVLDDGVRYDPVAFMSLLKSITSQAIRIHKVRMQTVPEQPRLRTFRVDGVAAIGASSALTRWVQQMSDAGWSLKAMDPTLALPGAFSYEVAAMRPKAGSVSQ